MFLRSFVIGPYQNFTYLVADREGGTGVLIDPSYGIEPVLAAVDATSTKIRYILNTHSHTDHIVGNDEAKARTGGKIAAFASAPYDMDLPLEEGTRIEAGDLRIETRHTPGHTPDSVLFLFDGHVATGDTLFVGECGRTDLPGGDSGELYDSLFGTVVRLDDATVILPGHDYGPTPTSTIGHEKSTSYVLRARTRDEFIAFMGS